MSARLVAIQRMLVGYAQHRGEDRSSPRAALIPPQIKDYGLGIPACLTKIVQIGTGPKSV
ncbi:MAG: hypothetical protein WCD53_17900 [Microcoleus sp.]